MAEPATLLAVVVGLILSIALTGGVRAYALRVKLLDVANDRSMHEVPTPRGGGLAIVMAFYIGLAILAWCGTVAHHMAAALVLGGIPIAVIGMVDDRKHVSSVLRLIVHLASCGAALWAYGLTNVCPSSVPIAVGIPIIAVAMAWCVNLYNFMDGLDGFSASEGVFVGLAGSFLIAAVPVLGVGPLSALIAIVCLGFLIWNWPPAKIFMGDGGSGFLGFFFAFVAATSLRYAGFFVWPILLSIFICDSTVTLLTRIIVGERWTEAHNTHAFQILAKRAGHSRVTMGLWMVNLLLVLPLAYLAATTIFGPWLCGGLIAFEAVAVLLLRSKFGSARLDPQRAS